MQPTGYTFAPRLKRPAPTAPSGAAPERPQSDERREPRRRADRPEQMAPRQPGERQTRGQANNQTTNQADRHQADRRRSGDAPRTSDTRRDGRRDERQQFGLRADRPRTDGQRADGRRAGAPWHDRQDRSERADRPGRTDQTGRPQRPDRADSGLAPRSGQPSRPGRSGTGPARPFRDNRDGRPAEARSSAPAPARRPQQPTPRPNAPQVAPAAEAMPPLESFFADAATLNLSPAQSFAELAIRPETRKAVDGMGISVPTPIQANAIPVMLDGRDIVGQAKTGSGKTLAFALPTVERVDPAVRAVQALILVPTRELAIQVGHVIEQLTAARRLKLTLLYGGRSLIPEARALAGGAQIVVGTPGRTLDHLRQRNLSLDGLRIFVLDEGDEMLDRGFAPDVERILAFTPPTRQTALFSATVPPWVMQTATRHLREPVLVHVDTHEAPPEIEHIVYDVDPTTRSAALRTLLDKRGEGSVIVFGRTKHGVKKLARQLEAEGFPVVALHGNLSQNARERAMVELRAGTLPILVATNVAARGIDLADVGQVINYEVPESAELFTHRVGRTGRMGRSGEAITFITPEEGPKWRQIERALGKSLPRQPWMVDGEPVPVRESAPAEAAAPAVVRAPRPMTPRADGERRRPRWRRSGR